MRRPLYIKGAKPPVLPLLDGGYDGHEFVREFIPYLPVPGKRSAILHNRGHNRANGVCSRACSMLSVHLGQKEKPYIQRGV